MIKKRAVFNEFLRFTEVQNAKESTKIGRSVKEDQDKILFIDLKVINHYLLNINTSVYKLSVWLITKTLQFLSANTLCNFCSIHS